MDTAYFISSERIEKNLKNHTNIKEISSGPTDLI